MSDVRSAQFLSDLSDGFRQCRSASIAVAYVTESGLELAELAAALQHALDSDAHVRILLDLTIGNTDPSAVWSLLALAASHPTVQVRAALPDHGRLLHSKFYLFDYGAELVLVTGSANLSEPALTSNIEHGLTVRGPRDDSLLAEAVQFFNQVWQSSASRPISDDAARLYEEFCGRRRTIQGRAERRSRASWRRLEMHLRAIRPLIEWPSAEAAYIAGLVCARGEFDDERRVIQVRLRFNRGSYPNGQVKVWNTSYAAAEVIPTIPTQIVARVGLILSDVPVSASGQVISLDLSGHHGIYDVLRAPFQPASNMTRFRLPRGLPRADEDVITEFVRGFAVASGLVTDGTSLPPNPRTGLPGIKTVWLRPQAGNKRLFDELHALIEGRLGIPVYTQWREYREPHLKIRCQDFLEVGFGVEWWDRLVAAGADYNEVVLG